MVPGKTANDAVTLDRTGSADTQNARCGIWTKAGMLEGSHSRTIRSIAWSPDGVKLATASFDSTVAIWEKSKTSSGKQVDRSFQIVMSWLHSN